MPIELAYFTQYFPAKLNVFIYLCIYLFACIFANTFKWKYACKQIACARMCVCVYVPMQFDFDKHDTLLFAFGYEFLI